MSDTSFGFLFFGSIGAIGAALAVGTLAAILRYHRTGAFPGHEPGEVVSRGKYVRLWLRVVLGFLVAAYGVYVVNESGVL